MVSGAATTTSFGHDYSQQINEVKRKLLLYGVMHDFPDTIHPKRVEHCGLKKIIDSLPNGCVITGSTALYYFGLIDRKSTNDLDLIAPHEAVVEFNGRKNVRLKSSSYNTEDFDLAEDIVQFRFDSTYDVDFFVRTDYCEYNQHDAIRVDNIANIIEQKAKLGRRKDLEDLTFILDRLHNNTQPKDFKTTPLSEPLDCFGVISNKIKSLLTLPWKF